MSAKIFSKEVVVSASQIDQLDHMNNVKYVELIQEISSEHWFKTIQGFFPADKYIWVVANHNISYLRPAFLNERLIVSTYVQDFESTFSNRVVEIKFKKSDKMVMRSVTKWCLLDARSQKPMKVTEEILDCFGLNPRVI